MVISFGDWLTDLLSLTYVTPRYSVSFICPSFFLIFFPSLSPYIYIYVCMYVCLCVYIYIYKCSFFPVCLYIYIHTYIHPTPIKKNYFSLFIKNVLTPAWLWLLLFDFQFMLTWSTESLSTLLLQSKPIFTRGVSCVLNCVRAEQWAL